MKWQTKSQSSFNLCFIIVASTADFVIGFFNINFVCLDSVINSEDRDKVSLKYVLWCSL